MNWQKVCLCFSIRIVPLKLTLFTEEQEEEGRDIDDIDGLGPAAEFEVWRLCALGRIKEKGEELQRELEQEEVERPRPSE